jgi:hypothetical protein
MFLQQEAKKPLTNADVIRMVQKGYEEDVIVGFIGNSKETEFNVFTEDGLDQLMQAGVSQKVIKAMLEAEKRKSTTSSQPSNGMYTEDVAENTTEYIPPGNIDYQRVEKFPEGREVTTWGSFMGELAGDKLVSRIYNTSYKDIWKAALKVSTELETRGRTPVFPLPDRGQISIGAIDQNRLIGRGGGAWMDTFAIQLVKLNDGQIRVTVLRKVLELPNTRQWRRAISNGKIERWVLTRIEDEVGRPAAK